MQETGLRNASYGADKFGFSDLAGVHWNLTEAPLYEHAIRNGEATVMSSGALCAETGEHTGRSPKDKHTVIDAQTENTVWWDGNRKMTQAQFILLYNDFLAHAKGKQLFAQVDGLGAGRQDFDDHARRGLVLLLGVARVANDLDVRVVHGVVADAQAHVAAIDMARSIARGARPSSSHSPACPARGRRAPRDRATPREPGRRLR